LAEKNAKKTRKKEETRPEKKRRKRQKQRKKMCEGKSTRSTGNWKRQGPEGKMVQKPKLGPQWVIGGHSRKNTQPHTVEEKHRYPDKGRSNAWGQKS